MIYHIHSLSAGGAYCGSGAPRERLINNWQELPQGHSRCLRCMRRLLGMRVNAKVPRHLRKLAGAA